MVNFFGQQRLPQRHLCGTAPIKMCRHGRHTFVFHAPEGRASYTAGVLHALKACFVCGALRRKKAPRRALFYYSPGQSCFFRSITTTRLPSQIMHIFVNSTVSVLAIMLRLLHQKSKTDFQCSPHQKLLQPFDTLPWREYGHAK